MTDSFTEVLHDPQVKSTIDSNSIWNPVHVDHADSVEKCNEHRLHCGLFNPWFHRAWLIRVQPLTSALLGCGIPTEKPTFITADDMFWLPTLSQRLQGSTCQQNSALLLGWHEEMWHPFRWLLPQLQIFAQAFVHGTD